MEAHSNTSSKNPSKLVIFLVVFVDLLGFGIMIPMLPFFARSMSATATEIGILMTAYSFMQIFVAPFWGSLSDRYGRRPILIMTILGQAFGFLLAGLSGTYVSLLISRVVAGIFAANISTASAYMADITRPEDRAKGMGLIGAAFGLGFIFGPAIGGILIAHGYQWPSLVASTLCFINFAFALFVLKEPLQDNAQRQKNRRRVSFKDFKDILEQPKYIVPILVFFFLTIAFVQMEVTFGLFVLDRFAFTERKAGLLLAFLGVVMAIVQGGLIGRLTKRFQETRLVLTGIVIIALGLATLVFAFDMGALIVALIFIALGYSLTNPCLSTLVSKAAPSESQGSVLGVYQSSASAARVLGPLVAGALYDRRIAFPLTSAIVFVMIAGLILIWRLFSRKDPTSI